MATCGKCLDGVIDTGNNDLPCTCPLGDTALFNVAGTPGPVSGASLKRPAFEQQNPLPKAEPKVESRYDRIDADWLPDR